MHAPDAQRAAPACRSPHARWQRTSRAPRLRSGALQEERLYYKGAGYGTLFECWAVADSLSLHDLAALCEWALTQLWDKEAVYTRAALELSPGALQRIARGLSAGLADARQQLRSLKGGVTAKTASAQIMTQWRSS